MENWRAFFQDKRVTLMGLGVLGRGVGDAAFFAECGAQLLVTDMKTEAELSESIARLKKYPNITFRLGGHELRDFTDTGMVIKAAGVPLDSPYIKAAREAGVPVYMSTALAAKCAREAGARIVGVTGTRGKSTVTQMIYHTLSHAGKTVHLGGNIRGVSTLALLPRIKVADMLVLELDSWQLQGFGDLKISPDVAVFTNLFPDHLNYYKGDMDAYFADKANIFRYQKEGDVLVVGEGVLEKVKAARPAAAPHIPPAIPDAWQLRIPGEHNRQNAALAAAALRALGVSEADIKSGIESFEGVEGRLQFVREVNLPRVVAGKAGGVKIYNDNNATTPEATIAALKALDERKQSIILIMGGADKGLDMSALLYEIARACKRVILLAGSGTDRVAPLMADYSLFDTLDAAVREALAGAEPGDTVLFSPAFASFGPPPGGFRNEYDRNDRFLRIVGML